MARGDRLRVERVLSGSAVPYMHHGIDVGDGTVVHARPDDPRRLLDGGRVVRTGLEEFSVGGRVWVTDDPPAVFSPDEIVARALGQVGREGYCPVADNCEHFASWCATGERTSRQVEIVLSRFCGAVARVTAAASTRSLARTAAETVAVRTAVGTTIRVGMKMLVPAAIAAEAAALGAEWTAHHAGRSAAESRRVGESAGMAASAVAFAAAGIPAGPTGVVGGLLAGAAVWAAGSLAAAATGRSARRIAAD